MAVPSPTAPPTSFGRPPGSISGINQNGMGVFHYNPPEQHLVRGQMGILQNENGQYMQQARQAGMELANARGQGSSSYAAGAAQRAALDAALPIAAQDSETLTRIGLSNAEADQRDAELERQKQILSSQAAGGLQVVRDPEEEANRAHQLQLQRERLAFEGEMQGLGRGHEYGMGLFGLEGGLFRDQMGYDNQRQMGFDEYGFDLGRMGQEFGYNSALARLGADLGLRGDYFNQRWGSDRDIRQIGAQGRMNLYANSILQGMQVPEFMANPEAFMGFIQFISGSQFDDIFGGI